MHFASKRQFLRVKLPKKATEWTKVKSQLFDFHVTCD